MGQDYDLDEGGLRAAFILLAGLLIAVPLILIDEARTSLRKVVRRAQ